MNSDLAHITLTHSRYGGSTPSATDPKCGTTWMTQIVHALRSGASMQFSDINEVCPWDILARDCQQSLDADQGYKDATTKKWTKVEPRCFKSHESWADVAKGGKYIYVARNPLDAFFSFYKCVPPMGVCHLGARMPLWQPVLAVIARASAACQ